MSKYMFSIDLKIGGKDISLNVQGKDTVSTILQNLKTEVGYDFNQQIYQPKIVEYLNQIKLSSKTSQHLRSKVQIFLKKQSRINEEIKQNLAQSFQQLVLNDVSFDKQNLTLQSNVHVNQNNMCKYTTVKHQYKQILNQRQQIIQNQNQNQNQKVKDIYRPCNSSSQKKHNQVNKINKKVDQDLVKAYETIFKKSKDKSMRQLAETSLKQIGIFKPQKHKKVNNFVPNTSTTIIYNATFNEDSQALQQQIEIDQEEKISQIGKNIQDNQSQYGKISNKNRNIQQSKYNIEKDCEGSLKKFEYSCPIDVKKKLIYCYGNEFMSPQTEGPNHISTRLKRFNYL